MPINSNNGSTNTNRSNGTSTRGAYNPALASDTNDDTETTDDTSTQSVQDSQQATQQSANARAQQGYSPASDEETRATAKRRDLDPNDPRLKPGYVVNPAARDYNAMNAARARQAERGRATDDAIDLTPQAEPVDYSSAVYVDMPAGGLHSLVESLYPDEYSDSEAQSTRLAELLTMNRDTLRNDTSYTVGQRVRIK
jgi:hypothetical protein